MGRPLQFSVPHRSVEWYSTDDPLDDPYLDGIADVDSDVELFCQRPYAHHIVPVKWTLDAYGLDIGTVHGPHLQRLLGYDDHGVNPLFTELRHLHLASVIDQTPEHRPEPAVSTHHAPRFWRGNDVDVDVAGAVGSVLNR